MSEYENIGQLCYGNAELLNKHIVFIGPFMRMRFMKIWRRTNGPQSERHEAEMVTEDEEE